MFEDIEEKEDKRDVAVDTNQSETPIHVMVREDTNALLVDGYEVKDGRQPVPEEKPSAGGDTDGPRYKYGWVWNGIDYRRASGHWRDLEKLNGFMKNSL